jgi:hypothetical protein
MNFRALDFRQQHGRDDGMIMLRPKRQIADDIGLALGQMDGRARTAAREDVVQHVSHFSLGLIVSDPRRQP